ncbi:hypothetical protein PARHAE_03894 [Paracoccus haematequi]|uniref:Uncharacterized protein n=1 Tax=Paracoccus haematequi TaxID=2491866 RepID=A0A3S4GTK5_9RHOB|nr:hypothetical protein [Paracoccus haematequi]VDS10676.1 hypothetical protein PARHAE_03894 [Paracoccus haematequi]
MLSLTDGFSIEGVDFFRDDEAKETFYYLPNTVELARNPDGSPQFQFVLYQAGLPIEGKQQGGGFMVMTTVLTAPADIIGPKALNEAQKILRAEAPSPGAPVPTPKIRPVNFTNGTAALRIARGPGSQLVTNIDLGKPSLFGRNTVSIVTDMPFEGAQVFADVLRQGGAIAAVEYNLEFEVRLPAVVIEAHISSARVRNVVATYTTQQVVDEDFWGGDTTTEVRKRTGYSEFLRENSLVELDIRAGSAEVEMDDDMISDLRDFALGAMDKFINEQWLNVGGILTPEQLQSEWLEFINEDFEKNFDLVLTQSDVILRQYNPSATIDPTFISADVADYLIIVDTIAHPFFKRLEVDVSTSFDFERFEDYVHSIVVDLSYDSADDTGRRIQKSESFIFTKDDNKPQKFITAKGRSNEYQVTAEVHYRNGPVLKQRLLNATSVAPAQVIAVANPGEIDVTFSAPAAGFDGDLQSIDIELAYEDRRNGVTPFTEERSLTKDAPQVQIQRPVYSPEVKPFRYRITHVFPTQKISTPWLEAPAGTTNIKVSTPFEDELRLDVVPSADWNELSGILVSLTYEDAANDVRSQQSLFFAPDDVGKIKTFIAPLKDPAKRAVSVAETHLFKSGAARSLPVRTIDATGVPVVVGNAPGGVYRLTISGEDVALGTEVRRVAVTLRYDDPANDVTDMHGAVLRGPGESSVWTVALADPAKLDYTYRADYFLASGERIAGQDRTASFTNPEDWLFVEPPAP